MTTNNKLKRLHLKGKDALKLIIERKIDLLTYLKKIEIFLLQNFKQSTSKLQREDLITITDLHHNIFVKSEPYPIELKFRVC